MAYESKLAEPTLNSITKTIPPIIRIQSARLPICGITDSKINVPPNLRANDREGSQSEFATL